VVSALLVGEIFRSCLGGRLLSRKVGLLVEIFFDGAETSLVGRVLGSVVTIVDELLTAGDGFSLAISCPGGILPNI
jgi:hypothetical protein